MPASTRSHTKQIHIDDASQLKAAVVPPKRKRDEHSVKQPRKAHKTDVAQKAKLEDRGRAHEEQVDIVTINRAPVLELWAASVASLLYKQLPWTTCLSIGGVVSTICAISKGRAIGTIDKADPETADKKRNDRRRQAESEEVDEVEIMSFTISIKNGAALVSEKPKKANEATLEHKFGELYEKTKTTFAQALETWKGDEDELDSKAFHMYEDFRPTVPPGQKGWGKERSIVSAACAEYRSQMKEDPNCGIPGLRVQRSC